MFEPSKNENKLLFCSEFTELPPTVNHFYRSTKGGRRYKTKAGREFQERISSLFATEWKGKPRLESDVEMWILFESSNRRRWDVDNRIKAVQDCLQAAGILKDDCQVTRLVADRIPGRAESDSTKIMIFERGDNLC